MNVLPHKRLILFTLEAFLLQRGIEFTLPFDYVGGILKFDHVRKASVRLMVGFFFSQADYSIFSLMVRSFMSRAAWSLSNVNLFLIVLRESN